MAGQRLQPARHLAWGFSQWYRNSSYSIKFYETINFGGTISFSQSQKRRSKVSLEKYTCKNAHMVHNYCINLPRTENLEKYTCKSLLPYFIESLVNWPYKWTLKPFLSQWLCSGIERGFYTQSWVCPFSTQGTLETNNSRKKQVVWKYLWASLY